jgi:hypothetical protein
MSSNIDCGRKLMFKLFLRAYMMRVQILRTTMMQLVVGDLKNGDPMIVVWQKMVQRIFEVLLTPGLLEEFFSRSKNDLKWSETGLVIEVFSFMWHKLHTKNPCE